MKGLDDKLALLSTIFISVCVVLFLILIWFPNDIIGKIMTTFGFLGIITSIATKITYDYKKGKQEEEINKWN